MAKSREFVGHTMVIGRTAAGKTLMGLFDEAQRIAGNPATKVYKPNAAASASDYTGLNLTDAEVARIRGQKRGGQ